jgi:hypothetical protein
LAVTVIVQPVTNIGTRSAFRDVPAVGVSKIIAIVVGLALIRRGAEAAHSGVTEAGRALLGCRAGLAHRTGSVINNSIAVVVLAVADLIPGRCTQARTSRRVEGAIRHAGEGATA